MLRAFQNIVIKLFFITFFEIQTLKVPLALARCSTYNLLNVIRNYVLDNISRSRPLKISPYFHFALKIHFCIKMKIRGTISIDFDLDKCYPGHNPE